MIAFKVEIDGEVHVIAGQDDWSILALHINASRGDTSAQREESRKDRSWFSVGGLSKPDQSGVAHHFRYKEKDLVVGSRVVVTVVETDQVDSPVKRYRSDAQVQEDPFTEEEARELRRQDYLELKKEFEP